VWPWNPPEIAVRQRQDIEKPEARDYTCPMRETDLARAVAAAAKKIQDDDKKGRMRLYERLGRQPDFTVKQ
jgi:hypothetical protein